MRNKAVLNVFMIIILFFLSSCREYFITTKINSNGTVERNIICKTDDGLKSGDYPESYLMDSLWNIQYRHDSINKKNIYTAEVKFNSYDKAVEEIKKQRPNFSPVLDIKIEKHFKFFFTYYTYKETYKPFNVFNKTPLDVYFKPEEITKLKEGSDSTWIKEKLDEYEQVNIIDMSFDILNEKFISDYHVKLFDLISKDKKKEFFADFLVLIKNSKNLKDGTKLFEKYFDKLTAQRLNKYYFQDTKELETLFNSMSRYDGKYENSIILPGMITSSNSKIIEGNKVSWEFDQDNFKYLDYEMTAESREVNTWFIIVIGSVILLLLLGLMLPKMRKKAAF